MISEEKIDVKDYERVSLFTDSSTGLKAIIALHSSVLGPAVGGCRIRNYSSQDEALQDVLYLSKGMTLKNALCGINSGGGKAVIIADPHMTSGRKELFQAFGECVQSFAGKYYTAEDMGTSVEDMENIFSQTTYVVGRDPNKGGAGDPSPFTARGVFDGIKACLKHKFGDESPKGKHIAIQGIGSVGFDLARRLNEAGAGLTVCDPNESQLEAAKKQFNAQVVPMEDIYQVACDVFAPCAIGGTVNSETIKQLQCSIVAGAANNQIHSEQEEQELIDKGLLYAPDFAINSGGVIAVADEIQEGGFNEARVESLVCKIGATVGKICDEAAKSQELPGKIALRLAQERIDSAK